MGLNEEMKHYTRMALIDTGAHREWERYQRIARANAEFLGICYGELKGTLTLVKKLVEGPWVNPFLVRARGQRVEQSMFLDL